MALGLLVLGSWAVSGPLHSGWAVAAGTPQLASTNSSPGASPSPLALAQPFADRVSGRVDSQSANGMKATGQATGSVDLGWVLDAAQSADGTTSGTLTITQADGTPVCVANIQAVTGQGFVAGCSPRGAQGSLQFVLRLRQRGGGALGGVLTVQPGQTATPTQPGRSQTATPAPAI